MNRNNDTITLSGVLNGEMSPKVQKALHDMITESKDKMIIFARDTNGRFVAVMEVKRCKDCPPELFDNILTHIANYGREEENPGK